MTYRRGLALAVVAAVACKSGGGARTGADAQQVPALLAHVPADTPYVAAALAAPPLEIFGRHKDVLGPVHAKAFWKAVSGEKNAEFRAEITAVLRELDGKFTAAGFESLGLSPRPRFAVYGLGLTTFVFRIEIADEQRLLASIERIARAAKLPLPPRQTTGDKRYWRVPSGTATTIVAIADRQLVVAVSPTATVDAKLGLIVGTQKPAASLADGAALRAVMAKHGFGPHLIGYVDSRRVAAAAIANDKTLPPACAGAAERLAAQVPRVAFGTTELTPKRVAGAMVVELAPPLLAAARALKTQLPGAAAVMRARPVVAFGAAMDVGKLIALGAASAGAIGELGAACGNPDTAAKMANLAGELTAPLPDAITKIRGAYLIFDEFQMSGDLPEKLEGHAVISSPAAKALFALGKGALPALSILGIEADGALNKVGIPGGLLPFAVYMAIGDDAIVAAAGERGRAAAEQRMRATAGDDAPLLFMSYDYAKFPETKTAKTPLEAEMHAAAAKLYGFTSGTVDVDARGLVFSTSAELK